MRKVHLKVVLDVLIYADDDVEITTPFTDGKLDFAIEGERLNGPNRYFPSDFGLDIIDIKTESMEVTDSR